MKSAYLYVLTKFLLLTGMLHAAEDIILYNFGRKEKILGYKCCENGF